MASVERPRLWPWPQRANDRPRDRAVVLIHGICSDGNSCFSDLISALTNLDTNSTYDVWVYDYDYREKFSDNSDELASLITKKLKHRRIDLIGHSMGGLVARMAVMRHDLKYVRRIITLATPNHGTVSGTQLSLLAQMMALGVRRIHPLYARAPGIIDLTQAHKVVQQQLLKTVAADKSRLDGKAYVSIPAQYYHTKRELGDPPPSLLMGGVTVGLKVVNWVFRHVLVRLTPVHDGIVEERSNRLYPCPVGSSSEATYLPDRGAIHDRIVHITHKAAEDLDHVMVTHDSEIAGLVHAVLAAETLTPSGIDKHLNNAMRVTYNPEVP